MNCEFCNKEFSSKGNLVVHQASAKYCLVLQGKTNTDFKCEHCSKIFTYQRNLSEHLNSCKHKKKKETEKKDEIFRKIQEENILLKNKNTETRKKIKQLEEKNEDIQNKLKEKDEHHLGILKDKNDYIAKLEAKLEKFEDIVLSKSENNQEYKEDKDESIPIPLKEQMSSIIIEDIKEDETVNYSMITLNNVSITSRPIDHYVNATQLCQAGGKLFKDWFRLESTKELINELSADGRILPSGLVETKRGGNNKSDQGSWIHPDLSIQLAQWISPKFAIQVSRWVRTLFNKGSVEIDLNLLREKNRDIRIKDHLIKELKSVCLSKQRRVEYPEKNVIYLLTTEDHLKRRTYIVGKAKNLTTRLGTYNKTCDHTVVYYKECKGEDDMDTAENMVLSKLRDYREKANRDRFILPEDKEISFFIGIIDECIRFIG